MYRCMRCCYQLDGRVEFAEGFVGSERGNVCGDAATRVVLVNDHEAVRLGDRVKNGFLVQWGKCARINNLCRNTVSLQRICRRECLVNHARDCHNRDVRALALNVGFAQGNYILALWYLTAHSIE